MLVTSTFCLFYKSFKRFLSKDCERKIGIAGLNHYHTILHVDALKDL